MSFEKNLLQMKKLIKKKPASNQSLATFVLPAKPVFTDVWKNAGLQVIENDYGVVFEKRTIYEPGYSHGNFKLEEIFGAFDLWNSFNGVHPISTGDHNVVFFDTETTGLKGTGTYIFLIGKLSWTGSHFEMIQYIMADPGNETAFLHESGLWRDGQTVITYNGKSFDWPQLQTRWTLNRDHLPKLPDPVHIDLLHGARRIWKSDLDQFKLTKIEEEKLGFKRIGDIPGHLAPIIYLDAIKSGTPNALLRVLEHNEWDILSLLTLFIHTTKLILQEEYSDTAVTSTNIGKWFTDLKEFGKSQDIFELIAIKHEREEAAQALYYLGYEYKRLKQLDNAYMAFGQSVPYLQGKLLIKAYEEMAKIAEHSKKEYQTAISLSEQAMEKLVTLKELNGAQAVRWEKALEKRLERLGNKLTISRGSADFDRKIAGK